MDKQEDKRKERKEAKPKETTKSNKSQIQATDVPRTSAAIELKVGDSCRFLKEVLNKCNSHSPACGHQPWSRHSHPTLSPPKPDSFLRV